MTKLLQPSFTGGELSPTLQARVDMTRYQNSLKTCRNLIVSSYGGVFNRPGSQFITAAKLQNRLIPFQFNITQNYVIEMGELYMRFIANGAYVLSGGVPLEIATPWHLADVWDVNFTQSADVMYLANPNYPAQTLSRTSATSFVLAPFTTYEGPFQPINANQAIQMASSGVTGNVTITCNSPVFTANMVGMFLYMENKNFSTLKPWTAGERSVALGSFRSNAGKTYQAIGNAGVPTGTPHPYNLAGGNAPDQDEGSQWDGPGDTRFDGTDNYSVGVLWQYVDSGYGIVQITSYSSATAVNALVVRQLPQGVVGGAGTPGGSWSFTGDGSTVAFSTPGNVSNLPSLYAVTIGGTVVPDNPNTQPTPVGPINDCVQVDSFLPGGMRAGNCDGYDIAVIDHLDLAVSEARARVFRVSTQPCWKITSVSGAWLIVSKCTKCDTHELGYVYGDELVGLSLPVCGEDMKPAWEIIVDVEDAGLQRVAHIDAQDQNYPAGGELGRYISTHNSIGKR
jgi:hypothetical protein